MTDEKLLELALEIASYAGLDWSTGASERTSQQSLGVRCCLWFCAGAILALLSLLLFPSTVMHHPAARIANLFLAPIASANSAEVIARLRSRSNPDIVVNDHFWQAFWFTLALAITRYVSAEIVGTNQ